MIGTETLAPGAKEYGSAMPAVEKPVPPTVSCAMLAVAVPEFLSAKDCSADSHALIAAKFTVVGLAEICGWEG